MRDYFKTDEAPKILDYCNKKDKLWLVISAIHDLYPKDKKDGGFGHDNEVFEKCSLYRELRSRTFASISNIENEVL